MSELNQIKILLHAYRNLMTEQYYDEYSENYQSETFKDLMPVIDANIEDLDSYKLVPADLINAVAHIGVDFGYGKYELEQKHIDSARDILSMSESPK